MPERARGPKVSEVTARLIIANGGTSAWLEPKSSKPDCDLVLEAKGNGKVIVNGSPVLTVEDLSDVDALAEALSNVVVSPNLDGGSP